MHPRTKAIKYLQEEYSSFTFKKDEWSPDIIVFKDDYHRKGTIPYELYMDNRWSDIYRLFFSRNFWTNA